MSQIEEFHKVLRDLNVVLDDIADFADLIEPVTIDGQQGYRLKALNSPDKIVERCRALLSYTWNCRDYVKKILLEHDQSLSSQAVGQILNSRIEKSIHTQVVSYLANANKHCGVDASQRWAVDIAPRVGKPYVLGQQLSFPHQLKPTVKIVGDKLADLEFVGRAGVDDECHEFKEFTWKHSCHIENKDGKIIGDVLTFCETAFGHWLRILREAGLVVFPYLFPVNEKNEPWRFEIDEIACICLFTNEEAIRAFQVAAQSASEAVADQTRYVIFRTAEALSKMLSDNRETFDKTGHRHLAIDPAPNSKVQVAEIAKFVRFLDGDRQSASKTSV